MNGQAGWVFSRAAGWCWGSPDELVVVDHEFEHHLIEGFPQAKFNKPYPAGRSPHAGERVAPAEEVAPGLEAVPAGNPLQRYQEDYVPTAGWPLVFPPQPLGSP